MEGDENWMIALSSFATKDNRNVRSRWSEFPVYGVLIETETGLILYDTGMNPADCDVSNRFPYYYRDNQLLTEQLKLMNYKVEDISAVVLSHLHDDHCGNLGLFTHADVYVAESEFKYVRTEKTNGRTPRGAYKRALTEGFNFKLVKADFWLTEKVKVINLPGHTPGFLGLQVHLEKDGVKLFVMDASNSKQNYGPPAVTAVGLYNNEQYYNSIEKIRNLEKEHNAEVIFGHDMEQFRRLRQAPDFYT